MAPLHPLAALRAAADLDVEAAYDGANPGEFFLILRGDPGHFDGAAAVGTCRRHRSPVGLVDLRRAASGPLPAVLRPGPSAGPLAGPLRAVLGEGCSLPFAGAAGLIELFLEVFAASLPAVSIAGGTVQVAGGAAQIVDQLGVLPLKLLDALVPRILLSPGRPRTVAAAALPGHAPRIGTCASKLHTTSRIFSTLPANQRRPDDCGYIQIAVADRAVFQVDQAASESEALHGSVEERRHDAAVGGDVHVPAVGVPEVRHAVALESSPDAAGAPAQHV